MPLYPLGLRPMVTLGNTASLPAVVLTTQYWQPLAGNQPALPNAANSQTRPFLLPVIWHSGCWVSGCWLTLQPQLEDTDLWPAYVLWRRSSLCAPKPHWSQGEDFSPLPHPFIFTGFAHELVGSTRWEHVLCKQFLLLPASAVQPGMRDLCSQKKSIQKRPVSLAPGS